MSPLYIYIYRDTHDRPYTSSRAMYIYTWPPSIYIYIETHMTAPIHPQEPCIYIHAPLLRGGMYIYTLSIYIALEDV